MNGGKGRKVDAHFGSRFSLMNIRRQVRQIECLCRRRHDTNVYKLSSHFAPRKENKLSSSPERATNETYVDPARLRSTEWRRKNLKFLSSSSYLDGLVLFTYPYEYIPMLARHSYESFFGWRAELFSNCALNNSRCRAEERNERSQVRAAKYAGLKNASFAHYT